MIAIDFKQFAPRPANLRAADSASAGGLTVLLESTCDFPYDPALVEVGCSPCCDADRR